MSDIKTLKAANLVYLDSAKDPNVERIEATPLGNIVNNGIQRLWDSVGYVFQIGGGSGSISFNNEDPGLINSITFSETDKNGRISPMFTEGDSIDVLFQNGAFISYLFTLGAWYVINTLGSPIFTLGETVICHKVNDIAGTALGWVEIVDTQFTSGTPQAFTSATSSLLRNDGLGAAAVVQLSDYDNWWDSDELIVPIASSQGLFMMQTSFTVVPSTADAEIELEYGYNDGGAFQVLGRKTIHSESNPFYVSEIFIIKMALLDRNGLEIFLKPNKDIEVYECIHLFKRMTHI